MSFFYILFGVLTFNLYLVALVTAILFEVYLVAKAATPTGLIVPSEDRRWMVFEEYLLNIKPPKQGEGNKIDPKLAPKRHTLRGMQSLIDEEFGVSGELVHMMDQRTIWQAMDVEDLATRVGLRWFTPRKVRFKT